MDFGLSQSDMESIQGGLDPSGATGGTAPSQQDQDNYAQASANVIASPIAGDTVGRSNILKGVNYDPTYAQALNISRGLLPGNEGGLFNRNNIPSSLLPQVQSDLFPEDMYYSGIDRFLGETAPELVRKYMEMGVGGLLNKITQGVSNTVKGTKEALKDGIGYLKDFSGGLSFEEIDKNVNEAVSNLVPATDLKYVSPRLEKTKDEAKQDRLNEMMFDAAGMKSKYAFDMKEIDASDFQPGGAYSVIGDKRSGNYRVVQKPDGGFKVVDIGI